MQQESSQNGDRQDGADAVDTEAVAAWIADTVAEMDDPTEPSDRTDPDDSGRQLLDTAGSTERLVDVLAAHLTGGDTGTDADPQDREELLADSSPQADDPSVEGADPIQPSIPTPPHSPGADEGSASTARSEAASASDPIAGDIDQLAAELQELRAAIEDAAERRQSTAADTTDQIVADEVEATGVESEFVWIGSRKTVQLREDGALTTGRSAADGPTTDALADRIDAIETRLADIESALDGVSLPELDAAVEQQRADYAALDDRLESELDSIEAVFEGLLQRIDSLESRLDGVDEARQRALDPLEARLDSQDALVSLIQEALRHGVTDADCHNCGQAVEIGLLETPHCPSCGRRFTRVANDSWLPFSTATLRTAATGSVGPRRSNSGQSR